MASLASSSRRSSSSYRSSSRYSTSSSFRSGSSLGGSSDSILFEPFDSPDASLVFSNEDYEGPNSLAPVSKHGRSSYGNTASAGVAVSGGGVRCVADRYYMSADVSQFEPHDVVVMAYNHYVVIHAEKVMDDGSVSDTFTHKSLFPLDMDPLTVSGTMNPDGTLVISVRRVGTVTGPDPQRIPTYCSEAHL